MCKLAYDDSWEQEFTSESHGNWREKDLLPETNTACASVTFDGEIETKPLARRDRRVC